MMIIEGEFKTHYGTVWVDGIILIPQESQKVINHSPDGFAWGYGGSGPAQLALAILLRAGVHPSKAVRLHQRFKEAFLVKLERESFAIEIDMIGWLKENNG